MNLVVKKIINNTDHNSSDELTIKVVVDFIKSTNHNYKTTHSKVCFPIIQRIYRRILNGYRFGGVKFNDNLIIDGHHRYIAHELANIKFEKLKGGRSHSEEIKELNDLVIDIEQDWDSNHPSTQKYCTDEFLEEYEKGIQ